MPGAPGVRPCLQPRPATWPQPQLRFRCLSSTSSSYCHRVLPPRSRFAGWILVCSPLGLGCSSCLLPLGTPSVSLSQSLSSDVFLPLFSGCGLSGPIQNVRGSLEEASMFYMFHVYNWSTAQCLAQTNCSRRGLEVAQLLGSLVLWRIMFLGSRCWGQAGVSTAICALLQAHQPGMQMRHDPPTSPSQHFWNGPQFWMCLCPMSPKKPRAACTHRESVQHLGCPLAARAPPAGTDRPGTLRPESEGS